MGKKGAKKTKGTVETKGAGTEGIEETKPASNGQKDTVKTKLADEKKVADETKMANEKRVVDPTKVANDNDIKKPNTNAKPIPTTESPQNLSHPLDSLNATSTIPASNNKRAGMNMLMDMEMEMEMDKGMDMNRSSPSCTRHFQWRVPNDNITFMLNADVALFKDIQLDHEGKSSCSFKECADSPSADLVRNFAESNEVWMTEFGRVFEKMLAHG